MTSKMKCCPCGNHQAYSSCCGLYLSGKSLPTTPEALMRSRYTAYTKTNISYIQATMKPPASVDFDAKSARLWAKTAIWLKLEVLNTAQNGSIGWVEFAAYYRIQRKTHVLHEISTFILHEGKWYYTDGHQPPTPLTS